jgi:hypothetical protein
MTLGVPAREACNQGVLHFKSVGTPNKIWLLRGRAIGTRQPFSTRQPKCSKGWAQTIASIAHATSEEPLLLFLLCYR